MLLCVFTVLAWWNSVLPTVSWRVTKFVFVRCHLSTQDSCTPVRACGQSCSRFTWRPHSHSLPCLWHHSHEKMYQVTGSWVRDWDRGYIWLESTLTWQWAMASILGLVDLTGETAGYDSMATQHLVYSIPPVLLNMLPSIGRISCLCLSSSSKKNVLCFLSL